MGKSKKKSATKVAAPPVAVPKSGRKGKRGAENKIEKAVSAKKQKLEGDEAVLAEQKADKEQTKKPAISTSDVDDSDGSDSGTEPKVVAKKTPIPAKNGSVVTKEKPVAKKQPAADNNSAAVSKTPAASETSESDGDDDDAKPASAVSNVARKAASSRDSSESDGDLSMEENVVKVAHAAAPKGKVESSESDLDKEKNSSDSNEETKANKPKPKTQETPAAIVSKILYVGNLSFSVEESDVRAFFKNAVEMVDVRFSINSKGKFRGFGHVEFATVEAAQKAMELNDQELLGRPVRLGYAPERPDFTPKLRAQTASVRGFDTSLGEDEIRSALQEHFRSCGEITSIYFSPDYESGGVKKMAYMDFVYRSGLEAALQKNKSDLGGGFYLNVQEAKSKGDNAGGRLDRGGKSGGGRGGRDGGRFSVKGGRDGGRGGRFSGRGGRGKKKTFWDD